MKAIQAQSLSGPEGLVYTDVETPGAGPNVVVVDVKAAGVCFPDYLMTKGEYQLKMEPPFVPGIETAGVVRSAPEGSGIKPGDRVMAFNFIGGYAERVAVAPSNILPTPPQLDDAEAVALIANYHTMYFAYARRGQLRAGETVLVLGAAGGIGTAAIQIAKGMGAKVIAVVNRTAATEFVKSVGADIVLPLEEGWAKAVREATGGAGVDMVVDPIGGPAFDDAVRTLASEGRLLVVGFAAGGIPTIKVNRLLLRNASLIGVAWGEFLRTHADSLYETQAGLEKLVAEGMRPPVSARIPLSEGRQALQDFADGKVYGKMVLVP
ncbi:NADPH:quinone oxidoreductase family protein [Mycobacteroides abscessus]|uniref:NADPH:quinone oxidoreductase family protein n=1 Tax=Mycobacteroides abscessus TaxID=36809 RepID=UPI0005DF73A7|nr:NADPH:quinone oxidoreductase family protein [Mycobacteroides abscessus]CPW82371.1 Probable oxidoreductase [Mycobacteroides abscessus]